jgi:hypothetical protein
MRPGIDTPDFLLKRGEEQRLIYLLVPKNPGYWNQFNINPTNRVKSTSNSCMGQMFKGLQPQLLYYICMKTGLKT